MFSLMIGLLMLSILLGMLVLSIRKIKLKKTESFLSIFYPVADSLLNIFPNRFFGCDETIKQKMTVLYGEKDFRKDILNRKREIASAFYLICLVFILVLVITTANEQFSKKELIQVVRPNPGEGSQLLNTRIVLKDDDTEYSQSIKLNIKEKSLTKVEIDEIFQETIKRIDSHILGENVDFKHVYKPLNLYKFDSLTQVSMQWYSDSDLVDAQGNVNPYTINEAIKVSLKAKMKKDEHEHVYERYLWVVPFYKYASQQEKMQRKLIELIDEMSLQDREEVLILPSHIDDIEVQWLKPKSSSTRSIVWIMSMLLIFLITTKYQKLNRQIKEKKEGIERDFPDFINKLVLLLNAGLIVQSALETIDEDYKRYNKRRPLYDELSVVLRNVKESQASLTEELRSFAKRCRVKEIMRFVSIVSENINMGSTLADKLQIEAQQIWDNRKHRAEVLGRVAETKLTFPLVVLLLVLIVIIMAPAFMEM